MANKFYQTFYTPQSIHLHATTCDEGTSNKAVLLLFQTQLGASVDNLINVLLDLK